MAVALAIVAVWGVLHLDATAFWHDEAYTLGALNDLDASVRGTHGTMALYYVVLWCWARVSTDTWWLRSFSLLCAVATLVVLRPLARRIGGARLVAISLPLTALGPMFEWKATEARSYALETLLAVLGWYVVVRAGEEATSAEGHPSRYYAALVPIAVAGVLCHGFFVAQLVAIGLVALVGPNPKRALFGLLPAAAAALMTLAWLMSAGISNVGTTVTGGFGSVLSTSLSGLLSSYVGLALLMCMLGGYGIWNGVTRARRTRKPMLRMLRLIPPAWALVPWVVLVVIWIVQPRFNPRYLAPSTPGIAVLLGLAAMRLDERLAPRRSRSVAQGHAAPPAVTMALFAMCVLTLVMSPPFVQEDWRGAARFIAGEAGPRDGIVFLPDDKSRPPFEAAWREVPHSKAPIGVSPGRPLGRVLRHDQGLALPQIAAAARGCQRLWVVEYVVDRPITDHLADESSFRKAFKRARVAEFRDSILVTEFVPRGHDPGRSEAGVRCGGPFSNGG